MILSDLLPQQVLQRIGEQYRTAVDRAVEQFSNHMADEDSVSGALNQELGHVHGDLVDDDREFTWKTKATKLRGRGRGAPEKVLGVDTFIEVEVMLPDGRIFTKTLPVQSKTEWTGTDRRLVKQAEKIARLPGGGIVVDYDRNGYSAFSAKDVVDAGGDRRSIPEGRVRSLGDALAGEFLECRAGSMLTLFDATRGRLWSWSDERQVWEAVPASAKALVRTKVLLHDPRLGFPLSRRWMR